MPEAHGLVALHSNLRHLAKIKCLRMRKRDFLRLDESTIPEWKTLTRDLHRDSEPKVVADYYTEIVIPKARRGSNPRHIRNVLYRFCESLGEKAVISDIAARHAASYRNELIARGLANASVNRYMDEVYSFIRCCRESGLVINDFARLKPFPDRKVMIYLSQKEETRLLKACDEPLRNFVTFLLNTGARRSEAIFLTWEDVTFERPPRRSWVTFRKTKNGEPHSVPLPNHVTTMLKEMKAALPRNFKYVFSRRAGRDIRNAAGKLVMQQGVPTHYLYPFRDFYKAREAVGLPHVNLHTCRHTYATKLVTADVPILTVSALLNHKNVTSSLQYVHLSTRHLERSVAALDKRT